MDEATAARILEQIDEKETVEFCSDLLRIPQLQDGRNAGGHLFGHLLRRPRL